MTGAARPQEAAAAYRIAAQAFLRAGHVEPARQAARLAGPPRAGDSLTARLHARLVRAELALAGGAAGQARRELRTGLDELARHQARSGSVDLQTAGAVHGRRLAELDLDVALRAGRAADVFAAVERGRAISRRVVTITPPVDPDDAELLTRLRIEMAAARDAHAAQDAAAETVHAERVGALQQQLRDRAWTASGSGRAGSPVAATELHRAARAADTAVVTYFVSAGRLGAVVFGAGAPALHRLGPMADVTALIRRARADLDVLALQRTPEALRSAVRASLASSLTGLDRMTLQPLGLAGRSAVLVSTGELGTLAWSALASRRGLPTVVTSSASAWHAAATAPAPPPPVVAAVAGPDLDRAGVEADAVAAQWPGGRSLQGSAAGREAVLHALAGSDVVHVAAHGAHQVDSPLFSMVRLADGPLFAHELNPARIRASHVVLSACELGRATLRPGDEALGLTSVLLHLGVRSVVAGVARVGDEAAAATMADYHRALAAGTDSATALAGALRAWDGDVPVPFVCFGSAWRPRRDGDFASGPPSP